MRLEEKVSELHRIIREFGSVAVAYSGGVDSALLLKICHDLLGDDCVALTARSPAVHDDEISESADFADELGVRQVLVDTFEITLQGYADNPPDRCFHCRTEMYGRFLHVVREEGLGTLVDGTIADDMGDHRPGLRAARKNGVAHPLREAGFTKADVREHARALGVPLWDKPAESCLSSRFPYGETITAEKLKRVGDAEARIRRLLGVRTLRLRHHDTIARLEFLPDDLPRAFEARDELLSILKDAGYTYATIDLQGYRTGSMNATIQ